MAVGFHWRLRLLSEQHINKYYLALQSLDARTLLKVFLDKCFSFNHYYIIGLNFKNLNKPKASRLNYRINELQQDDLLQLKKSLERVDPNSRRELISRLSFYEAGLRGAYVLKTKRGDMACIQWLVYPAENEILFRNYPRQYYPLREGEVMLEKVFVFPRFRGLGLLQVMSWELLERAKAAGFRNAVGYVCKDVIVSLNEFISMGFKIRRLVKEYKIFGYTKREL